MHAKHVWAPACLLSAAALALSAAPAGAAKQSQLKFFSHNVTTSITDPSGKPLTGGPVAGAKLVVTDVNYAGNHKRHARRYTSTDHLVCSFTGPATGVCDGQFTVGPSMLLSENVTIDFSAKLTFPITGGTGKYRGAKGTIVSTSIPGSADTDDVIKLR